MIQFSAKTYSTGSEVIEAVRALRYLHAAPVRKPVPELVVVPQIDPPLWQKLAINFDAHVTAYEEWFSPNISPTRRYIAHRAAEMGFTYAEIVGHRKFKILVAARQLLMWEVKRIVKPDISYPALGRLFGGRDHGTIIWAVRKFDQLKAEGKV